MPPSRSGTGAALETDVFKNRAAAFRPDSFAMRSFAYQPQSNEPYNASFLGLELENIMNSGKGYSYSAFKAAFLVSFSHDSEQRRAAFHQRLLLASILASIFSGRPAVAPSRHKQGST